MTDYISREEALDCFKCDLGKPDHSISFQGAMVEAAFRINDIPAADVRPNVTGRWIRKHHNMMGPATPCCSECGKFEPMVRNYCPNCGAKMEVEKG